MKSKIYYITDSSNWVISEIGRSLERHLIPYNFKMVTNTRFNFFGIKHYSTRYAVGKFFIKDPFAKRILTYFHGEDSDTLLLQKFRKYQNNIDIIHTSCLFTKYHLIKNGIRDEKIKIIPIGIDVDQFKVASIAEKLRSRAELGIPSNSIVIGSFQKDGNGWDEGNEPKLCKGPDLFCDVIEKISQETPVFVLLTGPARGYVKNRLKAAGILFKHIYLEKYQDIHKCFAALDLYLVTSRLEGGPRAPMECMASGIPIISTKVGQTPELIEHGTDGYLVDIGQTDLMKDLALNIISNNSIKNEFIKNGLEKVKSYDYKVIAKRYYDELYCPLMK